jgi:hypothetical protein
VREYEAWRRELPVTQVLIPCMFFLGNPSNDRDHHRASSSATTIHNYNSTALPESGDDHWDQAWMIERYQRRKAKIESGPRHKPIFRAGLVVRVEPRNPHVLSMAPGGSTEVATDVRLRLNHYWGARATGFGPDTPDLVASLVPDSSVNAIVSRIKSFTRLVHPSSTLDPLAHPLLEYLNCTSD